MRRLHKKNQRLSRYEAKNAQREKVAFHQAGTGHYVFRNITKGTLDLPKAARDGITRKVGPGQEWEGDSYFMSLVKSNIASLVREIKEEIPAAEPEVEQQILEEGKVMPTNQSSTKLILDQPDTITDQGKVEHVVIQNKAVAKKKVLKPTQKNEEAENGEILLTEDPLAGVQILG